MIAFIDKMFITLTRRALSSYAKATRAAIEVGNPQIAGMTARAAYQQAKEALQETNAARISA